MVLNSCQSYIVSTFTFRSHDNAFWVLFCFPNRKKNIPISFSVPKKKSKGLRTSPLGEKLDKILSVNGFYQSVTIFSRHTGYSEFCFVLCKFFNNECLRMTKIEFRNIHKSWVFACLCYCHNDKALLYTN